MRQWLCRLVIVLGSLWLAVDSIHAANGVTISPPFQNITIAKDQAGVSFGYSVTNNDPNQAKSFTISASDFGSLDESGGVAFVASTPGQVTLHGLINWLFLNTTKLTLGPGETKTIQATVKNESSLAPGGHYGAILLGEEAPAPSGAKKQVIVQSVLSTLLFVNKIGGEKYDLKLDNIKTAINWWQSLSLVARFYNNGNVDVVPRGLVRLIDPRGREVARAAINEGSSRILPGTYRRFTIPLISTRHITAPGRYKLQVQYRYDGKDNFSVYTKNIYYAPFGAIALLIGILFLITIISIAAIFGYNKYFRKTR